MDFSKAFDSVPHNRLLLKLNHFGIQNNLLVWISNFLKHREQRVVVGGEHLAWTDVIITSGVPQGTVLGPLLFLAYINDLPSNISSNVRLFADDCVIYRQIVNDHDHISLQEDLNTLEKWQRDWQMKFNAKKCFTMRITHNRNPKIFNYKLGECILETTNSHPYLSVCITSNLSWSTHINNITSSANRSLGFIRRNLYSCSKPMDPFPIRRATSVLLWKGTKFALHHGKMLTTKRRAIQILHISTFQFTFKCGYNDFISKYTDITVYM